MVAILDNIFPNIKAKIFTIQLNTGSNRIISVIDQTIYAVKHQITLEHL